MDSKCFKFTGQTIAQMLIPMIAKKAVFHQYRHARTKNDKFLGLINRGTPLTKTTVNNRVGK